MDFSHRILGLIAGFEGFCEDGLVHKIVAEDGKQYFAVCVKCEEKKLPDTHFHFYCTDRQTIECLPSMVHFSVPQGYEVEGLNCVLIGVCMECSEEQKVSSC